MQTIVLCVGLPGSGKTSSSDMFVKQPGVKANVIHVEDWLSANNEHVHDRYGNQFLRDDTWPNLWRHAKDVVEQYGGILILDLWLRDPKRRKEVVTELRKVFGAVRIVCWHFVTPPEVCKDRYVSREMDGERAREPDIPDYIISGGLKWHWDSFAQYYVPVSDDELGLTFDEIVVINNGPDRVIG